MTPEIIQNATSDFQQIVDTIVEFNRARGWNMVAGDAAKSVVLEAAELLENFQWDETSYFHHGEVAPPKDKVKIGEEAADVLWYLVTLCAREGIDLQSAFYDKVKKNGTKYPEDMFQGKHNVEFYKSQKEKYREERKK